MLGESPKMRRTRKAIQSVFCATAPFSRSFYKSYGFFLTSLNHCFWSNRIHQRTMLSCFGTYPSFSLFFITEAYQTECSQGSHSPILAASHAVRACPPPRPGPPLRLMRPPIRFLFEVGPPPGGGVGLANGWGNIIWVLFRGEFFWSPIFFWIPRDLNRSLPPIPSLSSRGPRRRTLSMCIARGIHRVVVVVFAQCTVFPPANSQ